MESVAEMTLLQQAHHLDKDITLAINACGSDFTDWMWMLFSNREIWYVLYVAVLVFFFIRLGWKRATVATLMCILTVVCCDQLGNLVKDTVQRLRPCEDGEMIARGLRMLECKGGLYGFFSAHAANAMGFAVCSLKAFRYDGRKARPYAIGIVLWALMVGASRVFVGKHFLGDVCVGFVVGALVGFVMAQFGKLIINKICKSK